ncbi:MAG: hypothetical protein IH592_03225 [Bacteroidales bacterium]|nr:hypothetical protein [Bacteroidales bacterium]
MDFIKAVSIIGRDLEEAIALLDQLYAEGGSNIAEIELARLRVRSATELLRLLPGLNGVSAPAPVQETRNEEPVMQASGKQLTGEPVILTDGPQMTADPVIQTVGPMTMEVPAAKSAGHQKTQDPQKPILADRFASMGTLGEKMQSAKQEGAISSVMHSKPIADIGAAIGMNDKFYFIRELFSGDTIAYHDTIIRLNAAASLGEAMKILDESTVMGSDPAAQSSFVDVVRRKFNIHV